MDVIVGTAGHIDHGKTALVSALTGVDTDRLPEEKTRGITIDLGFAEMEFGGVHFGFVDVPGHERFVKNMLAGASGVDVVMLVVAADEGVMPQTREHFDICRLLDVRSGIVALTKRDLVDDEMLDLVRIEVAELVEGSFLENAPTIAVDSLSGRGIDELRSALVSLSTTRNDSETGVRVTVLPIDRSFAKKGFGTVVTGTLVSGAINDGDELELLPDGLPVRVRGLQTHSRTVKTVHSGQRTAVNLAGVDHSGVSRGMVLAERGVLKPTQSIDAEIEVLASAKRPLRSRQRVRFHIGSTEILARLSILNKEGEITPGERDFAQLRLEAPTVAVLDDRFVLRSYSPQQSIAGGVVLEPDAARHKRREMSATVDFLRNLRDADTDANVVCLFAERARENSLDIYTLRAKTGWTALATKKALSSTSDIMVTNDLIVGTRFVDDLSNRILEALCGFHRDEPLAKGITREALQERLGRQVPAKVSAHSLAKLEAANKIVVDGEIIRIQGRETQLTPDEVRAADSLRHVFRNAGLEPPKISDALADSGEMSGLNTDHVRRILTILVDGGEVVKISDEFYFDREVIDGLKLKISEFAAGSDDGFIDVPEFKRLASVSRKFAIPLLEYFDREKVTVRSGDKRLILK